MTFLSSISIILYVLAGFVLFYLLSSLFFTYLAHQFPRNPVKDPPDWGNVFDTTVPAIDGRSLEVWRIDPKGESRGVVLFAHGWGRNRDRMVNRARQFAEWGFTTVIHSARDHGNSSPKKFMTAIKFAEDIEVVLNWINMPVILYGHSAGSAGAIIAASRNKAMVRLLFLEASYPYTKEALLSLYRWINPIFGKVFGPMILFWMELFHKESPDKYSPGRLARQIEIPVMIIHGKKDQRFPLSFAQGLKNNFPHEKVSCYFAEGAGHSDASQTPGYNAAVKSFIDKYADLSNVP
jgi:pimeloyl-ACP methyl ester carboxylesterase